MKTTLDFDTLSILVAFVLPGLVSMQVYRLLMPSKEFAWMDSTLQAFFYSSFNFAILFPLVYAFTSSKSLTWLGLWALVLAVVFIGPVLWPILLVKLFRSDWVAKNIKIPYPSTWDYFFDDNPSVFLLLHLNSGDVIGGLWSQDSRAGQHPRDGDLYLEALYEVNEDGTFGSPIPYTRGLLIRKDQYTHIEIFAVPEPTTESDVQG